MSNLAQRILVAAVGIPLIVMISMAGGVYFFAFTCLASGVALHEFYALARAKGAQPMTALGIVAGFFVNLSFYHPKLQSFVVGMAASLGWAIPFPSQPQLLVITLVVTMALLGLVELFRNKGSAILNLSSTVLGILYISLFFGTWIGIRELFVPMDFPVLRYLPGAASALDPAAAQTVYRWGGYTVISIFSIIWICDTAAFQAGRAIGRHPLFPRVSPKKTWEGAIFGFVFAVASALLAKVLVLEYLPVSGAVVIGLIVGVVGQMGDLVESLLKRDAGVKDSSSLLPGHGGVFDRFDSLLFVAPLAYLYLDYILLS